MLKYICDITVNKIKIRGVIGIQFWGIIGSCLENLGIEFRELA